MAKTKRIPRFRSDCAIGRGRGIHIVMAKVSAMVGARINKNWEEVDGRIGSLIKSLTPSAIGWRSPKGPIILGPLRCCI